VLADVDAAGRSELENGPQLAGESTRRLACDASIVRLVEDADGLPKNSAELFRDTTIETLNREQGLKIDAGTCVFPDNGAPMDYAMAVEGLLHRDGALELDPAIGHYPAHFPPARE
jgi:hypothetical protein